MKRIKKIIMALIGFIVPVGLIGFIGYYLTGEYYGAFIGSIVGFSLWLWVHLP